MIVITDGSFAALLIRAVSPALSILSLGITSLG